MMAMVDTLKADEGVSHVKQQPKESTLKRDNYRCSNCGSDKELEIHHTVSR